MKPTWFTTDPTVPPIAKKIFLLASMLRVLRCQCPMVTPASFGGNACPHAIPAESIKIPHKTKIIFVTTYSFLDCQMCNERLPKLVLTYASCHKEKILRILQLFE